jgi:hypothetical protein
MKNILLLLLVILLASPAFSQKGFYNASHQKKDFTSEEIDLTFEASQVNLAGEEIAPVLAAAIPLVLDFGFKTTTKILEKKVKEYSAEYSKYNSYLGASEYPPIITFSRTIIFGKKTDLVPALIIKLEPKAAGAGLLGRYIYYEVTKLDLIYSAAKSTERFPTLDYTIELKLDYLVGGERKNLDLKPIVISSVKYEVNPFLSKKSTYRTEFIALPEKSMILGASIKIVETNPGKVRAEKILSAWNDNKEGARTIINTFVPKEEKAQETEAKPSGDTSTVDGEQTSSSNTAPAKPEKKVGKNTKVK